MTGAPEKKNDVSFTTICQINDLFFASYGIMIIANEKELAWSKAPLKAVANSTES